MFLIAILLSLFGFFSGSIFGRFLSSSGTRFITSTLVSFSFFLFVYNLIILLYTQDSYICKTIPWIILDNLEIHWAFSIDSLSAIMLFVVTSISSCVHLYSTEYMYGDPHQNRFMSYLSLFTFFMLILITANNFLQMFIGWEGVGVSSYLLINFWFTRLQANKSAIKAMLANRVGDFFLLLALFAVAFATKTYNYELVFTVIPLISNSLIIIENIQISLISFICFCLLFGAMGKSAQLGLHTWLPDAMEGPTPVSALIHAATMVTAGVFLIARCSFIFEFSPVALNFMAIIGICTAFFAATTGLFQNDMKKVIAYSTCSQLGYMICACGLSSYDVAIFHLSNHAFFKALLFLGAGSVIHALQDEQDMRKMGGLQQILPFSYAVAVIGSFALVGFPFLAGFYSKDVILELSISKYNFFGTFSWVLGCLAAFCTAFYSTRLIYLVFLANPNGNKNIIFNAHEGQLNLTTPLFFLAIFSIFIGYLTKDFFIGIGNDFWNSALFINFFNYHMTEAEFLNILCKQVPLILTVAGILLAFFLFFALSLKSFNIKTNNIFKYFYIFFNKKWFVDKIYNSTLNQSVLNLSLNFFYKQIDRGLLEKIGPFGLTKNLINLTNNLKNTQTGFLMNYLNYFYLAIISTVIIYTNAIYLIFFNC